MDDVWPFAPETGYSEKISFLTDVLRTYSAEQRIKLRKQPRRSMSYSHLLDQEQLSQAKLKARRYGQTSTMFVPVWADQKIFTGLTSGDTVLDFGTQHVGHYEYNIADKVILWTDWDDYIVRDIASTTSTTITLSSSIGVNLSQVFVMPLRQCVAYQGFTVTQDSPNESYVNATWTLKESSDVYNWILYDLFDLDNIFDTDDIFTRPVENYNGIYVRKEAPHRLQSVENSILQPITLVDNGFGPIATENHFDYINNLSSVEFFWSNPVERAEEIRDFLGGVSGRAKAFYLPTFSNDMVPISGVYSGTSLSFEDYGIPNDYLNRVIMIELNNGTKTYNTITAAVQATSEISVTLDSAISLDTSNLKRICFMNLVRCDVDDFELFYYYGGSGTTRFTTMEVPN